MGLRIMLLTSMWMACAPTSVSPLTPWEPGDPAMDERVDLIVEGVGFESYEGVTLWAHVLEAESPPMPADVEDGAFHVVLPASYDPDIALFLSLGILVDYDDDGGCSASDFRIFAPATVIEPGNPTLAFVELDDPDVMYEPCL